MASGWMGSLSAINFHNAFNLAVQVGKLQLMCETEPSEPLLQTKITLFTYCYALTNQIKTLFIMSAL